jgi:cation diffusion facilitator family transporter
LNRVFRRLQVVQFAGGNFDKFKSMKGNSGSQRDKYQAATRSAIAAVGLTFFKLLVGILTGSLGLLAEAAHSGLDLAAALMTAAAVRMSDKPADEDHLYGHGKIENLSALLETLLLLATCAWVIHSAVGRLRTGRVEIEVTFWSFAVMAVSIIVDASRSRVLYRAAKEFNSQALEADALHFSTDIWSSAVVILGLAAVKLGQRNPSLRFLSYGDPIAAIFVGLIVVYISARLGYRTVANLLDTAPPGLRERIAQAVLSVPGIQDCRNVRLRYSGPHLFIDLLVLVDGRQSLREAHDLTEKVELAIHELAPEADVTVHPEPYGEKPDRGLR